MESSKNWIALVCSETVITSAGPKTTPFHGVSVGPTMEICEISGVPISIVPRFHKRNVYIKRNLRVWRTQKCIALVCGENPPTCAGVQTFRFHGQQYRAGNGDMRNFGVTNVHCTAFALKEWLCQKEATGMESSKCIALVGEKTVLTSAGPQTTPFHGGQYIAGNSNIRNSRPTNLHGTAFAPNIWHY